MYPPSSSASIPLQLWVSIVSALRGAGAEIRLAGIFSPDCIDFPSPVLNDCCGGEEEKMKDGEPRFMVLGN